MSSLTNEAFLCELHRKASRDSLELSIGVVARVDLHSGLGAPERHIDTRTLVRHQSSESSYFILIDIGAVADSCNNISQDM